MSFGLGLGFVFVGVNTAANAGVPADKAGLAAALVNTSTWIGGAPGLAILSVVATTHTHDLLSAGDSPAEALTGGFQRALTAVSIILVAAALVALRATNTTHTARPTSEQGAIGRRALPQRRRASSRSA